MRCHFPPMALPLPAGRLLTHSGPGPKALADFCRGSLAGLFSFSAVCHVEFAARFSGDLPAGDVAGVWGGPVPSRSFPYEDRRGGWPARPGGQTGSSPAPRHGGHGKTAENGTAARAAGGRWRSGGLAGSQCGLRVQFADPVRGAGECGRPGEEGSGAGPLQRPYGGRGRDTGKGSTGRGEGGCHGGTGQCPPGTSPAGYRHDQ